MGTKTSNDDNKSNEPTLTLTLPSEATWPPQRAAFRQEALGLLLDHDFDCLCYEFVNYRICVILRSSVRRHIDS